MVKGFVAHGDLIVLESDEETAAFPKDPDMVFDTNPDWYPHLSQPKPVETAETDLDETPKKESTEIPEPPSLKVDLADVEARL